MKRRDFIQTVGIGACALNLNLMADTKKHDTKKKKVVIVGGGIGGINTAQAIKANDPDNKIEVTMLERNSTYFACPLSNTLFGEIKEVIKDEKITFKYNYKTTIKDHKVNVVITEVTGADVKKKTVTTTNGVYHYDYLVIATGISDDYKLSFPKWNAKKVARAQKETPAGMISDAGVEKEVLLAQMQKWKKAGGKGDFIIVTPFGGKIRCKPAPYERACMVSEFIKKHKLKGKVQILDNYRKPKSKGPKFIDMFLTYHKDTIVFNGMSGDEMLARIKKAGFTKKNFKTKENFKILEDSFASAEVSDVNFDEKYIDAVFYDNFDDDDGTRKKVKYEIASVMPKHKANVTTDFFDVKRDKWGGVICEPKRMYSVSDNTVYAVGDVTGFHKLNPSAQVSASMGLLVGKSIAKRAIENKDELDMTQAGITCYSMVSAKPLKAIEIAKKIKFTKKGQAVPYATVTSFTDGYGVIGWYQAVVESPFKW